MAQNVNNLYPTDEIDLRQLFQALWTSKWLIIVITAVVTLAAAAYSFLSTPVYQTSVHLLPPTASGLASYNVASQLTGEAISNTVPNSESGIAPLSTTNAYRTFLRHLKSASIRQAFFDAYYLPAQENDETEGDKQRAWKRLNNQLIINLPKNSDELEASLTLQGQNPQTIAQWANSYISLAEMAASEDLLSGLTGEVQIRKLSLEDQIAALRQVSEKTRRDLVTRLQGALVIAENIGLEEPAHNRPLITINTGATHTDGMSSSGLLYLRGTKALRAELEALQQREADDAYIPELPDLLKKQALLNSINLNPELISVATIDRAAIVSEEPIKPQKTLIIAIGFILGAVLGILSAVLRQMIRKY